MTPAPMLAMSASLSRLTEFCNDDRYELSQKLDGKRLMVQLRGGVVAGFNRRGERADVPKQIAKALARCPIDLVADGELVGPTWHVFDLPEAYTVITPESPLRVRRAALETLFLQCGLDCHHLKLLPSATTTEAKTLLAQRVLETHAEGLMAKDLGPFDPDPRDRSGAYLYGQESTNWHKLKIVKDVDCVAVGFGRGGRDNIMLAVFDNGEQVDIGEVTRQAGDGPKVRLNDVLTVRYLTWSGTRLVQPNVPRIRTDKLPHECTLDQLVVGNTKETIRV